MVNVGIVGSTGYAGQQLVWFLKNHKYANIVFLSSNSYAGKNYSEVYPQFENFITDVCIDINMAKDKLDQIDVLFIALPHGKSFELVKDALSLGVKVIDLGADYRISDSDIYKHWYGLEHEAVDLLPDAVYGLPELYREKIKNADLIANPGCYPTASLLALAPLLKNKLIDTKSIIIDAKSGISGAGRGLNVGTLYGESSETMKAYNIGKHRHTPEIEQIASDIFGNDIILSFTPHLIPMNRGILATCYGTAIKDITIEELFKIYNDFYKDEKFVRIKNTLPETRWVKGTNICDISVCVDERTNRIIVVSAIDNLIKGAAGQAVQNMNIIFDFDESEGLEYMAMLP